MRLGAYIRYENVKADKDLNEIYKCPHCENEFKIADITISTRIEVIIKYANTINQYEKGKLVKTVIPYCPRCNECLLFSKFLDVNLFPNER